MDSVIRGWQGHPEPDTHDESRKVEMAVRQLERAELYVVSAINLELDTWEFRQALHDLRCHVLDVSDQLRRPRDPL